MNTQNTAFAAHVQAITDRLTSPPLTHAVAIKQVYDVYGRQHEDAGSLESFKQRLVQAHVDHHLSLLTLDDPLALDASLRDRSAIPLRYRKVHLITRSN